jgi:hypothetical protein
LSAGDAFLKPAAIGARETCDARAALSFMRLIHYHGHLVAIASPLGVQFLPPLDVLPEDAPRRRFVGAMAAYPSDIAENELVDEYDQAEAELYARSLLIDNVAFKARAGHSDEYLAAYFRVPLEQIAKKRLDQLAT